MKRLLIIGFLCMVFSCAVNQLPVAAQTPTSVGLQVIAEPTDSPYLTGKQYTFGFDGSIGNPPEVGQECTLQGPSWSWTFSGASGTTTNNNSNGTFTVTFNSPGTYTITATAAVSYNTSGSECGGPYADSNSASITITVVNPACPLN